MGKYQDFKAKYGRECKQCAGGASLFVWYVTGIWTSGNGGDYCKGYGALNGIPGRYIDMKNEKWKLGDIGGWRAEDGYGQIDADGDGVPEAYGHVAMWNGDGWWGFNQGCGGTGCNPNTNGSWACTIPMAAPYSMFRLRGLNGLSLLKLNKGRVIEWKA